MAGIGYEVQRPARWGVLAVAVLVLGFAWSVRAGPARGSGRSPRPAARLLKRGWTFFVSRFVGVEIWRRNFCRNPPGTGIRRCRVRRFVPVGFVPKRGWGGGMALLRGGRLLVAKGFEGLAVVRVSGRPRLERTVRFYGSPAAARDVAAAGRWIFVAMGRAGLSVAEARRDGRILERARLSLPGGAISVAVRRGLVCVGLASNGLAVVDVSRPARPRLVGTVGLPGPGLDVDFVRNRLVAIAAGRAGTGLVDLSSPSGPRVVGTWLRPEEAAIGVASSGGYVASAEGRGGILLARVERSGLRFVARHWSGPIEDVAVRRRKGTVRVWSVDPKGRLHEHSWSPRFDGEVF